MTQIIPAFNLKGESIVPTYRFDHLWLDSHQAAQVIGIDFKTFRGHVLGLEKLGRISEPETRRTFTLERKEGNRTVKRTAKHYNTRAVMLVAFRSNSEQALDFQEWAIDVLIELRQKGVVYATPEPQITHDNQEIAELKAKVAQLQGVINEANLDMNEGQVPWFGGQLAKRVTYLIGSQRGVRPRAQLPLPPKVAQPASEKLLHIIRRFNERGQYPTSSEIRCWTGRDTASRMTKEEVVAELERLENSGQIRRITVKGRPKLRYTTTDSKGSS